MMARDWMVYIYFFISFLPDCLSVSPKFLGELKNVTVTQGRDATFTCSVTHLGGHRVAWIKSDSKAILAIHDHVITNNARLQVTHNDKDTWTLLIRDVKQKDSGQYMCQVNSVPMVSQTALLEVVIPPEISDKHSTKDVSINEGVPAKFVCAASGHPPPQISWKKQYRHQHDRTKIRLKDKSGKDYYEAMVHGEVLSLPPVTRDDMGTYICIAQNGVPPAISKSFKLVVNFKPQIEVSNNLVGAPLGTYITLRCQIEASPKPITYWKRKSGEMLVPSSKYNISEESIGDYRSSSTLHINMLNSQDFTEYQCVAKNTIGKSEETVELYELQRDFETTTTTQTVVKTYHYFEADYDSDSKLTLGRTDTTPKPRNSGADRPMDDPRNSVNEKKPNSMEGFFGGISSGFRFHNRFCSGVFLMMTSLLGQVFFCYILNVIELS